MNKFLLAIFLFSFFLYISTIEDSDLEKKLEEIK